MPVAQRSIEKDLQKVAVSPVGVIFGQSEGSTVRVFLGAPRRRTRWEVTSVTIQWASLEIESFIAAEFATAIQFTLVTGVTPSFVTTRKFKIKEFFEEKQGEVKLEVFTPVVASRSEPVEVLFTYAGPEFPFPVGEGQNIFRLHGVKIFTTYTQEFGDDAQHGR